MVSTIFRRHRGQVFTYISMKLFYIFILTLFTLSVSAQGDARMAEEDQLLLADPFVLEDDGWFYIYGTYAKDGIVVYRSRDMRVWSDRCGRAKNSLALHKDDVWGEKWFWAPEVYKVGDKYVMTYSAEEHICYAEAESPCGPFVQKEKKPYFPDIRSIDSSFFFDDDGKAYIYWVHFDNYGIWVAELSDDLQRICMDNARLIIQPKDNTWERFDGYVSEGPIVIKHKGKYYLTYSCNDYQSQDYAVGVAVAESPMGPFRRVDGNPILRRYAGYVGTGHHALLSSKHGLYIIFHAHNSGENIHPRQTLIAPISFKRDRMAGRKMYRLQVGEELIIPKIVE